MTKRIKRASDVAEETPFPIRPRDKRPYGQTVLSVEGEITRKKEGKGEREKKKPTAKIIIMSSAPPPPPPQQQQQLPNRVAVAQMTSSNNRLANYSVIRRLARQARDAGASILFLPECCCFLGESAEESVAAASPLDEEEENGHVIDYYRALAREFGLWLSLGGIQETCDRGGEAGAEKKKKMHNTHVVLRDDGSTAARYRKVHLFELAAEGLHESRSTEPGDSLVVVADAPCGETGGGAV